MHRRLSHISIVRLLIDRIFDLPMRDNHVEQLLVRTLIQIPMVVKVKPRLKVVVYRVF